MSIQSDYEDGYEAFKRSLEQVKRDFPVADHATLIAERDAALAEAAAHKAEAEKLRAIIYDAVSALESAEEINPSNYDHDLVCNMNRAYGEAWSILAPTIAATPTAKEN